MSTAPQKATEQAPPLVILTTRPSPAMIAPPDPAPPISTPAQGSQRADRHLLTGRNRHLVTFCLALSTLGVGGGAYAMDPSAAGGDTLLVAPIVTLGAQAVMALVGYLRDYGKDKLDAEKQRTLEANARAEKAEARIANLEAELRRIDAERDKQREDENQRLRDRLEDLLAAQPIPRKTPDPLGQ